MNHKNITAAELYEAGARVFLCLDFDGVINIDPGLPLHYIEKYGLFMPSRSGRGKAIPLNGEPIVYPLAWSHELIEGLNEVLSDPRVALVWLTTWKKDILPVQKTLGLTPARESFTLDYLQKFSDYTGEYSKHLALEAFLQGFSSPEDSALVWIDDTALYNLVRYYQEEHYREVLSPFTYEDSLLIEPESAAGISREQLSKIKSFVEKKLNQEGK